MKKILVIDDERDVLEIVRTVLKTKGYAVRCAEGGEDGLRQAEADRPDLIICDLMMPRVSGLEVIKRVKANPRLSDVPMVILSAVAAESDRPEDYWARGLGVDEYICKPFDPLDMIGRVEALLRRDSYGTGRAGGSTPIPVVDLESAPPKEIARLYIESWNTRDWNTEFNCLADDMMGAMQQSDYVARRAASYADENGANRRQEMTTLIEEKITGLIAKVICERRDTIAGRPWMKRTTYTMKKTSRGWKIVRAREEPIGRAQTSFE